MLAPCQLTSLHNLLFQSTDDDQQVNRVCVPRALVSAPLSNSPGCLVSETSRRVLLSVRIAALRLTSQVLFFFLCDGAAHGREAAVVGGDEGPVEGNSTERHPPVHPQLPGDQGPPPGHFEMGR